MVVGPHGADDGRMDTFALAITAVALLGAASFAGAGVAGVRMCEPQLGAGRAVALAVMAFALVILGVLCAALAWWLWRFSIEFTF